MEKKKSEDQQGYEGPLSGDPEGRHDMPISPIDMYITSKIVD